MTWSLFKITNTLTEPELLRSKTCSTDTPAANNSGVIIDLESLFGIA
jgi:hypothetical protein